jgi:hypothetical protein
MRRRRRAHIVVLMRSKLLIAIVMTAAGLATAGCSDDRADERAAAATPAPTADERHATERARWFLLAMEARQDARACEMMTRRLRHGITFFLERNDEPGSCRTRAAHIYSMAKAPGHPDARIKTLELGDGAATAVVTARGGVESDVELRKVAGRWLIADF